MGAAIKIIPENLEKEMKKRGLNNQEVSEAIGHGRNYVSDALRRGRIGKGAVRTLEILYQIHPRDYVVPEPWQACGLPCGPPRSQKSVEGKISALAWGHRNGRYNQRQLYYRADYSIFQGVQNMKIRHMRSRNRKGSHITIMVDEDPNNEELVKLIRKVLREWRRLLGKMSFDVFIGHW